MKQTSTKKHSFLKIILLGLITMVFLSACSRKMSFQTSAVVPAAEGKVKVKKDKNNNYRIELNLSRLADPKRLDPSRELYVVWMDTQNNGIKNIGRLATSSGMFSSALKSSLRTVTPYKPVRFFITAEDRADITYSGGQKILETKRF